MLINTEKLSYSFIIQKPNKFEINVPKYISYFAEKQAKLGRM